MIKISSDFDSGNIAVVDANDPNDIKLEIKSDGKADFYQWFYYQVDGASGRPLTMRLMNAHGASYVDGWKDYRAVASYDGEEWFRIDAAFDGKELTIKHQPEQDRIFYAYFAPYTTERYRSYIASIQSSPVLSHEILGQTLDGQDISYLRAGNGPRQMWVIARQHPGETMGSWWIEGFLNKLTAEGDEDAATLMEKATLHIVPCMNLDGAKRGHLRTNAAGIDLNRAWQNTTMEKSPEVYLVRERMREIGVDFFLDVHGDEAIPNNFLDSANGIPSWDDVHAQRFERFSNLLLETSADFQTKDGYPPSAPGKANLDIANSYVAETWGCLSMTLEMPFKDANVNPDQKYGWSPARCRNFAQEHLTVMAKIVDGLR
ncbi:M14-type cytosolic carboxypeptidase [Hyphococcus sp. DH-69]|uniref:M14 family metallopeptidase n=1 Tax=Hyphococcus formosus TaxID=3143534 RepID=UPI00398AEB72